MKVWVDDVGQYFEPTAELVSLVVESRYEPSLRREVGEVYKIETWRDEFGNKVKTKTYIGGR